jgi:hypothetical protein
MSLTLYEEEEGKERGGGGGGGEVKRREGKEEGEEVYSVYLKIYSIFTILTFPLLSYKGFPTLCLAKLFICVFYEYLKNKNFL